MTAVPKEPLWGKNRGARSTRPGGAARLLLQPPLQVGGRRGVH